MKGKVYFALYPRKDDVVVLIHEAFARINISSVGRKLQRCIDQYDDIFKR